MKLHDAILRLAALLAPRELREEWSAEWMAELWYIQQDRKPATAFCLGAFKDALWLRRDSPPSPAILRLESPFLCLSILAALTAMSVFASWHFAGPARLTRSPSPGARNLVLISHYRRPLTAYPTVRMAEFQSWTTRDQRLFTDLAFYQPHTERLHIPGHPAAVLTIARASGNLFDLLHIALPGPDGEMRLVLSQSAWAKYFDRDPHIPGEVVEIASQSIHIAGVIPGSVSDLPLYADAWLLEDTQHLAALPPDSRGFVLARAHNSSLRHMFVAKAGGGHDYFDCVPLYDRVTSPVAGFLIIVLMSAFVLPAVTSVSLGDCKSDSIYRWLFLAAKSAMVLLMVYCWARYLLFDGGPVHGLLIGCVLAFRWVLVDQRRRCPVCLRLLTNPVRIGRPSQTFLDWYGTELMCVKGHGLLHVPEISNSYSTQRWLHLDRSWAELFSGEPG